jgi:transposase
MPIVADEYTHVIGVDTHARTHTYVVIESATGRLVASETFPSNAPGRDRALKWIRRRAAQDGVIAAVEGTNSYGSALVETLKAASIPVVEARPPRRAMRAGHGKSDVIDAEAAARSVLGQDHAQLLHPRSGKLRSALRVLLVARRSMDTQRTADRNSLTALLRMVDFGVDVRKPLTDKQVSITASWRIHPSDDIELATARQEAIRLARDVLLLTARLVENKAALKQYSTELAPGLLAVKGVGPVTAAVFLTTYSHPGRVRNEAAYAALAGASPLPASSGNTTRHRLNRHGDRQLNSALDVVARVRLAVDPETRAYKARRLAEGKSAREIRRLLKRYIARQIYRQITAAMSPTT